MNSIDPGGDEMHPEIDPLPEQALSGSAGKIILAAGAAALNAVIPGITVPVAVGMAALDGLREKLSKQQEARLAQLLQSASEESTLDP
ncbi:hypothetical protein [Arthrobacter rhizosphaerae]|uniref:hypothetical protein n=1 Tax=Arthrobacter rhizosphaerae TaxID=2855490 RepID=UPI001FF454B6|nr:hypothetical protein [Arthrobacter rhizosphaerae]